MAFPTPRGTPTTGNVAANDASTIITLPSGIVAGDRVQVWLAIDQAGVGTWPSGWTQTVIVLNGTVVSLESRYRTWTGSETADQGGDGTIEVAHADNMTAWVAAIVAQVGTYDAGTSPDSNSTSTGNSASPDVVTALDPAAWGTEDTAWYVACAWDIGTAALSSNPASYAAVGTDRSNSTQGVGVAVAKRDLAAASENPGAFTLPASRPWGAVITAHRPSGVAPTPSPHIRTTIGYHQIAYHA